MTITFPSHDRPVPVLSNAKFYCASFILIFFKHPKDIQDGMAYVEATHIFNKNGSYYIQTWVKNTLYFWRSKIDIYWGKFYFFKK